MDRERRASAIPHVAALDGARGAAVAAVLLFHGGHLVGGYLGVDFFFTLSGFLITSLLLAEASRSGSIGLGGFWARRARRLLPALAVLMVGIALYCAVVARPEQLAQIRGDALATLAYGANWREVFARQDYFLLFTAPSPLNHTWSLAIEEQFYVIWPLVVAGIVAWRARATAKVVLVTALALAAGSSVLMFALYDPANISRVYFGTDTRAGAILLGVALAAALSLRGPARSRQARMTLEAAGIIGAVVLAIAWTHLDGQSSTLFRGGFLLCGIAGTAVIAAAVHPQPGLLSRALSFRPLCLLGLISYGVYLYHWPIDIVLDEKRVGLGGWPLFAVQTTVTLAFSFASYRIVEQPIRRGALSSARLRRLTPAIALGVVAILVASTSGARTIQTPSSLQHPVAAAANAYRSAPPGSQRVMIVGNSIAYFLGVALGEIRAQPQLAVFNAGIRKCTFPPSLTRREIAIPNGTTTIVDTVPCDPSWEAAAVKQFRPDIVLWIGSDPYPARLWHRTQEVKPCTEPYETLYRAGLRHEATVLGATGAKVIVTTAAYPRYFGQGNTDGLTDCDNRLIRSVASQTGMHLVDLFTYICPAGRCRARQDGATLRTDGLHYEGAGGRIVARWLIGQARAQ